MSLGTLQKSSLLLKCLVQSQCKVNQIGPVTKRWAGHSKWSNIKHIKMSKDAQKSATFQRICQKIVQAVKEGGSENPDVNYRLKTVLEEARRASVPNNTIQNAIKTAKSSASEKPYWLFYTRPDGLIMAFEVSTPNVLNAVGKINQYAKRLSLKHEKQAKDHYIEKGIILCDNSKSSYDKALEDGITIGVDEVEEAEDKTLVFQCAPNHVDRVNKELITMGYNVHSASTELEFHKYVTVLEEENKAIESLAEKLHLTMTDLSRVVDNVIRENE